MENSQGNSVNPPISLMIDGTAVAMIVASIATRPVESITAIRTGPRSDRSPTSFSVTLFTYPGSGVSSGRPGEKRAGSPRRTHRVTASTLGVTILCRRRCSEHDHGGLPSPAGGERLQVAVAEIVVQHRPEPGALLAGRLVRLHRAALADQIDGRRRMRSQVEQPGRIGGVPAVHGQRD